ncbi:hypothetical protein [Novipirellula rosea]|uniref:Uncharacterized protein n=1 Tax=Novipirellula rosea TaxID=1031540 RepID=A0ABP8NMH3_9BACT
MFNAIAQPAPNDGHLGVASTKSKTIFETTLALEQQHWPCCLEWKARSASGAGDGRWCRSLSEDTRLGIDVDD